LEGIYYWTFAPKKQIQFRWYGGLFLKNQAKNNSFNFGISKINDYNFTYSLLGQSATSGLYSQEFILAEGGFKSYVGSSANQWILALNTDVPIWKIFGIYMDLGMYKNKGNLARFVWDSGVRLSLVPNVLEVYFPVQSALGFEPALERYDKRIRFSLNLEVDNLIRTAKKIIQ
ncbi:MAG: aminopeptidase, partial [Flavobacteriaceae bacterium]|nr:aminopeptidase [Flavobacteriaceae bacterium]